MAVDHGVHIHFNKTMTTTVDEDELISAAANAKGVKLVSSPGELINPRLQRIKELVEEGALGTITWAATGATFGQYHENETRVRGGADRLTNVNPACLQPRRWSALRYDCLWAARTDRGRRPRQAGDGALWRAHQGT